MSLLHRIKSGDPIISHEWNRLLIARKWKAQGRALDGLAKSMRLSVKTLNLCLFHWQSWW